MEDQAGVSILRPYRFDASAGTWVAGSAIERPGKGRLTIVTYNLWFGERHWEERIGALLGLVRQCGADVIGFQEVTPPHLERILAEDWIRRDYQVSDAVGDTLEPHGVLLLSRLAVSSLALCHLPSRKDRKMVVGMLEAGAGTIVVGTVHLESAPLSLPVRLEQLDQVLPSLHGAKNAVLMGDFNFDSSDRDEQSRIEPGYTDLWPALHTGEPGYTVDSVRNRMRLLHKQKHKRARFDRILLRSMAAGWEPESIRLLGTQPISAQCPDVYPSDHFGLVGVIARRRDVGVG
jgi:endonuclease/exonuclease/phosphatase family metal-dependent hydrolase